ncbi:MAG: phosphoribosyl-AMP cyclohydrolase [Bryobacterales bacterium]
MMDLDFEKTGGLIPVVVQDVTDGRVLMVGFMNEEAFQKTVETGKVTSTAARAPSSGSRARPLATTLVVKDIQTDCDKDTLLIQAESWALAFVIMGFGAALSPSRRRRVAEFESKTYDPKAVYAKK